MQDSKYVCGKKILIVCNYFAPENTIAAVRISKLAKYLKSYGYEVSVFTEKKDNIIIDDMLLDDIDGIRIIYAENSKVCKFFCEKYSRIMKPIKDKRMGRLDNRERINPKTGNIEFYPFETAYPIIGSLDYIVGQFRQKNLAQKSLQNINIDEYDYLITSYGDSFSYFVGKRIKKRNKTIPWIFDIRDAIYRYKFTPVYVSWIPKSYERYVWKYADAIVGVSKGICKRVPKKYRYKTICITNGFEKEESIPIGKKDKIQKMSFTYTGSMYGGLQNLSEFFRAVKILLEEDYLKRGNLEFCYAGNLSAYDIFINQAKKYGLQNMCVYKGKLTRKEAITLQYNSDILLMASYDYKMNNGGIITGKLLEYMASGKPVIAIVTGDVENSEVSQIIYETNIGVCYETSSGRKGFNKLKEYIKKQYQCYEKGEELIYQPKISEINKYDYKNIAKKYRKLLYKLQAGGR